MAVKGTIKKAKIEAAFNRRLERGKKKMQAKAMRQARKMKEQNRV